MRASERIVETQVTDKSGMFTFRSSILAATSSRSWQRSKTLAGGEPDSQRQRRRGGSAVVKLPFASCRSPGFWAVPSRPAALIATSGRGDRYRGRRCRPRPSARINSPCRSPRPPPRHARRQRPRHHPRRRAAARQFVPESDVHLLDRLAVLYRYRRLCVTVFVLSTRGDDHPGLHATSRCIRRMARLVIDDERSTAVPGLQNDQNTYYEDPEPYYQTQHKILKGRDLTRRVVRKLHLETVPEFNGTTPPPPTPITMLPRSRRSRLITLIRPRRRPCSRSRRRWTRRRTSRRLVSSFIGRVESRCRCAAAIWSTSRSRPQDPKFAATAANALVDEYVEQNLQIKLQSTQGMLDWLEQGARRPAEEGRRQRAGAGASIARQENALSLDEKQNIVLSRLNQLNDAATRAGRHARPEGIAATTR